MVDTRFGSGSRDRSGRTRRRSRPTRTYLGIAAITVVSFGLVLLSPLVLVLLNRTGGVDWAQLSNIGQAYGVTSAVVSSLALGGVALSLVLQAREAKLARLHAWRSHHLELMQMALADPLYLRTVGPFVQAPIDDARQRGYINLVLSWWQMLYEIGELPEPRLRLMIARQLLTAEPCRRFWALAREGRAYEAAADPKSSSARFHQIVDEEYQKAVAAGPPASMPDDAAPTPRTTSDTQLGGLVAASVAAGLLLGRALHRRSAARP